MSKQIRVAEEGNGECIIRSTTELSPESEFAIKSLAGLQLICIGRTAKTDPKLVKVLKILKESINQIQELYQEDNDESINFPIDYN